MGTQASRATPLQIQHAKDRLCSAAQRGDIAEVENLAAMLAKIDISIDSCGDTVSRRRCV